MPAQLHRVKATAKETYTHQNSEEMSLIRKAVTFENLTNIPLTILDRNNIPMHIPAYVGHTRSEQEFIITTIYTFSSKDHVVMTLNMMKKLKDRFPEQDPNRSMVYDMLVRAFNKNDGPAITRIVLKRSIPLDDFNNHHSVYQQDTDLLVCTSAGFLSQVHPYSDEGLSNRLVSEMLSGKKLSGTLIEMIDNENKVDDRYIYLGKKTFRIPALKDPEKPSGVYVTNIEQSGYGEARQNTTRMSYDEAEETIGLFKTEEMAVTGGNPELLQKANEKRFQLEMEEFRRAAERETAEHKREEARSKAKISEFDRLLEEKRRENQFLKEELDARKSNRDEVKSSRDDYYESRSYVRKDSHEIVKYIPAILAVGLGAAALFRTRNN